MSHSPSERTLIVESWRGVPHSYAIVNQFHCLEILKRPDVRLFHRDVPFHAPHWQGVKGLFSAADEAALQAIPSAAPDQPADAILRMSYPLNFEPAPVTPRLVVWGTTEFACVLPNNILGGRPLNSIDPSITTVAPSNWAAKGFANGGIDPSRLHVVPHGFDPQVYHPLPHADRAAVRRPFRLNDDGAFYFLHIGTMTRNKGVPLLLTAMAQVIRKHPRARLLLKGLDSLYGSEDVLNRQFPLLPKELLEAVVPHVHYFGKTLSFADMARLYQAADAYVAPYHGEGFNLPVLEAAACGLPVVCTQGGPTDDFTTRDFALPIPAATAPINFPSGVAGLALNPDLDQLVAHMNFLIETPDFRQRARTAGAAFLGSRFTWKHVTDQFLNVLFPSA